MKASPPSKMARLETPATQDIETQLGPQIAAVESKIEAVESKIEAVESKIDAVENKLTSARADWDCDLDDIRGDWKTVREYRKYLRDEKKQLRRKEEQLRDEKKQLRDQLGALQKTNGKILPGWFNKFKDVNVSTPESLCKLNTGSSWLCGDLGDESLFVRKCYIDLYKEVTERLQNLGEGGHRGLILIGSPGIGKSCFLNYLLVRLLELGKTVYVQIEKDVKGYLFRQGVCMLFENQFSLPYEVSEDSDAVHLFDPRKSMGYGPPYSKPFCIVASSPRKNNWKQADGAFKKTERFPSTLYAPCWSEREMELHASKTSNASPEAIKRMYHFIGGVPRSFYGSDGGMNLRSAKEALEVAVATIDIAKSAKCIADNAVPPVEEDNMTHKVFSIIVLKDNDGRYDYRMRKIGYVSEAAEEAMNLRISNMDRKEWYMLYARITTLGSKAGSLRGAMFQGFCHQRMPFLLAKGIDTGPRHFKPQRKGNLQTGPILSWKRKGPKNMMEIEADVYYKAAENYPAIDGVVKLEGVYFLLQYTISDSHPINLGLLSDVIKLLPNCGQAIFIWVHDVPVSTYSVGTQINRHVASNDLGTVEMWHYQLDVKPDSEVVPLRPTKVDWEAP